MNTRAAKPSKLSKPGVAAKDGSGDKPSLTRREAYLVGLITSRVAAICADLRNEPDRRKVRSALTACHLGGCPLNLSAMLDEPRDSDLVDEVGEIMGRIDEETGALNRSGSYSPKYALSEAKDAVS